MSLSRSLLHGLLLFLTTSLFFCTQTPPAEPSSAPKTDTAEASQAVTLKVALYPYVPRIDQFKSELEKQWKAVAPEGVTYELVDWDCYSADPPADLDVFVFDGIFLDYFQSKGYLKEMPVSESQKADVIPFFLEGCKVDGAYYGLPQLGCANLLFHRKGDKALAEANSLAEIEKVLGQAGYDTSKPPKNQGLMVDMSGGTTDSCFYIETVLDLGGEYTTHPELPPSDELNPKALNNLHGVVCMAGKAGASYEPDPYVAYQRARWFGEGYGRAVIGFSESMSVMKDQDVAFKLFPLATPDALNLFYTDIVSVNAGIADNKLPAAQKMAELLSSAPYFNGISQPTAEDASPQYLMPVHHSSFKTLGADYPLYNDLYQMVQSPNAHILRLGQGSRDWLTNNKSAIQSQVLEAQCGD